MISWKYKDATNSVVFRLLNNGGIESFLIAAPEIQAWLAEGNTPEPADPIMPVVPQSVTMRQARLALLRAGLLDDVDAAIAAIPDPAQRTAAQIEWEYATVIERNSPLVQSLAAGLGLTAPAIDALFEAASRI